MERWRMTEWRPQTRSLAPRSFNPSIPRRAPFVSAARGRWVTQLFKMRKANPAAFSALPMPTVPTGQPGGSWAIA